MLASYYAKCIDRARAWCAVMTICLAVSLCALAVSCYEAARTPSLAVNGLAFVAFCGMFGEFIALTFLTGHRLIPINIEHAKERLGALQISVTLTFRELRAEYEMTLVPPHFHVHAPSLSLFRVLGLALLAVGVSVKLVAEAVVENEPMCLFRSRLMGCSVGKALLLLWIVRVLKMRPLRTISVVPRNCSGSLSARGRQENDKRPTLELALTKVSGASRFTDSVSFDRIDPKTVSSFKLTCFQVHRADEYCLKKEREVLAYGNCPSDERCHEAET
jgi:hypothetical protein